MKEMIGRWSFIIGLIISILAGVMTIGTAGLAVLLILGIIVGLLNVTGKEVTNFLLATIAMLMVGTVGLNIPAIGTLVINVLSAFTSFVAGAAFIVAIKEVFAITSSR